jgi:hypothetical protein
LASDYDLASVFKDLNFKGSSVVGSLISSSIGLASAGTTMATSALKNTGATDKLFGSTQLVGGFQDDIFNPILIILIYDKYKNLIFPINPEEFTINTPSNSQIVKIHNLGDRSIPQRRGLSTFSINSFFWAERNWFVPPQGAIEWLETWRDSGKPAHLIVTKLNYSYKVTCENLKYTTKAGEENDIYFTLDLKEFRPFKIKLKSVHKLQSVQKSTEVAITETSSSKMESVPTVRSDVSESKKEIPLPTSKTETTTKTTVRLSKNDSGKDFQQNIENADKFFNERFKSESFEISSDSLKFNTDNISPKKNKYDKALKIFVETDSLPTSTDLTQAGANNNRYISLLDKLEKNCGANTPLQLDYINSSGELVVVRTSSSELLDIFGRAENSDVKDKIKGARQFLRDYQIKCNNFTVRK